MFTSAELIDTLQRRARRSLRPGPAPGEFPSTWTAWFDGMRARVGAITGATVDAILDILLARDPTPHREPGLPLNGWQSFAALWRQQWQPAGRDTRSRRRFALVVSVLVHALLALLLVYIAYVRLMAATAPPRAGDEVIQVQYVGEATPDDVGGGPPAQQQAAAPAPPTPVPRREPAPATASTPPPAATTAPTAEAQPTPPTPAPPVAQPLQVTETLTPDQTFVLPPPRTVDVPTPALRQSDVQVAPREITVVEIPPPPSVAPRPLRPTTIAPPVLLQRAPEVAVREVATPLPTVTPRDVPTPVIPTPQVQARAPEVAVREIPTPPAPLPAATAQPPSATPAPTASVAPPVPASRAGSPASVATPSQTPAPAAAPGTRPDAVAAGVGAAPTPRPGASSPSTRRGDDWDTATRNRPGGQAGTPGGLFNADGTPRLAPNDGRVGGGLPPGTITEDFAKIDRNGTWLTRPSTDYTPTSFDKFWVPSETLLQEWVRRSIKEVLIPVPGTSKTIKCSIVVLALGGGCGISDPNMQDIEATARKPPDVPFKRELQEDQQRLGPPSAPAPPP